MISFRLLPFVFNDSRRTTMSQQKKVCEEQRRISSWEDKASLLFKLLNYVEGDVNFSLCKFAQWEQGRASNTNLHNPSRCRARNQINVNDTSYFRNYPKHCVENIKSGFSSLAGQTTASCFLLISLCACGVCMCTRAAFINKFLHPQRLPFAAQLSTNFSNR